MSDRLPEGKTCGDCANFKHCLAMFRAFLRATVCDWNPSHFIEAAKPEPRSPESLILGIMEQMERGTYVSPLDPPPGDSRAAHRVVPGTRQCAPDCECWASRKRLAVVR